LLVRLRRSDLPTGRHRPDIDEHRYARRGRDERRDARECDDATSREHGHGFDRRDD
jgi:hypothetical protein